MHSSNLFISSVRRSLFIGVALGLCLVGRVSAEVFPTVTVSPNPSVGPAEAFIVATVAPGDGPLVSRGWVGLKHGAAGVLGFDSVEAQGTFVHPVRHDQHFIVGYAYTTTVGRAWDVADNLVSPTPTVPLSVNTGGDTILIFDSLPAEMSLSAWKITHGSSEILPSNFNWQVMLKWTQVNGPAPVQFLSNGFLATSVRFTMPGEYNLRLSASDGRIPVSGNLKVTVIDRSAPNLPPVVNAGTPQTIQLPQLATLRGTAADNTLVFPPGALVPTWTGPANVTFGNPNSFITTAEFSAPGSYTLTLEVFDGEHRRSSTVSIQVLPPNTAPVVSPIDPITLTHPASTTLQASATDDGGPFPISYTWTTVAGPPNATFLEPNEPITGVSFPQAGIYRLRVTASDGALSGFAETLVTVNPPAVNQPPIVNAGPDKTIALPQIVSLAGSVTDPDQPSGTPTAFWEKRSGPGTVFFANDRIAATTASFSQVGTYVLRLTGDDGTDDEFDEITIQVVPVVYAGPNQSVTRPALATLAGTAATAQFAPDQLQFVWTQETGSGSVSFGNPNALNSTADFSSPGTYTLRLSVYDKSAEGAPLGSSEVTITVVNGANQPPTVTAGSNQTIALTQLATLTGTAFDDGMPTGFFEINWTSEGPGSVSFGDSHNPNTTASFTSPGTYTLRLTGNDAAQTRSAAVTVIVVPVVYAGANQNITLPSLATLAGTAATAQFPQGSLTTTWKKMSGPGTVTFGNARNLGTTAEFSLPGNYVLRLDGELNNQVIGFDEMEVNVSDGSNSEPQVTIGANQTIALPQTATLTGSVTDDGFPTPSNLIISWSSADPRAQIANPNSANTTATFTGVGTYVLQLTGNDGLLRTTREMTVTVVPVVSAGANQTTRLPNTATISGTAATALYPAGTLGTVWSRVSGAADAIIDSPSSLSTTLRFNQPGNYVFRLTALHLSNGNAVLGTSDVSVTVDPAIPTEPDNERPVVSIAPIPDLMVLVDANLQGTATDDGKPIPPTLTFKWRKTLGPLNGNVFFGTETSLTTTVRFSEPGSYELELEAYDGVLRGTARRSVIVLGPPTPPVNRRPDVFAGQNQTLLGTTKTRLEGSALDDGLPTPARLTYEWALISPGTAEIKNPTSAQTDVEFGGDGIYLMRLTVRDGALFNYDDVIITVNPTTNGNQRPIANAGPDKTIGFGSEPTLIGSYTDDGLPNPPNQVTTRWILVTGPGLVRFGNENALETTVTFSKDGIYLLRLTANDNDRTGFDDMVVTVLSPNSSNKQPTVNVGKDLLVAMAVPIALKAQVQDDGLPSGNSLKLTWEMIDGPEAVEFDDKDLSETNVHFLRKGNYKLRLTVTDGVLSAFDELIVIVNDAFPNAQPPLSDSEFYDPTIREAYSFPNPVRQESEVSFFVETYGSRVVIRLYDETGTYLDKVESSSRVAIDGKEGHLVKWNVSDRVSGVYYAVAESTKNGFDADKKRIKLAVLK